MFTEPKQVDDWSLARWDNWLVDHPDAIHVRYHDDHVLDSEFRCHNTVLHLAVLGHWAAEMGVESSEFVALLLGNGADPNAQNDAGKTPLHLACEFDTLSSENVRVLLASGAAPDLRDKSGEMPLDKLFGQKDETQKIQSMLENTKSMG